MEPVSSSISAILKVVQAIANAVETARQNKAKCQQLARRAQEVARLLQDSKAAAAASATTRGILGRLKGALDDALELVESCRRSGGLLSRLFMLVRSGGVAAKLADVNGRISDCIVDLSAAIGVGMDKKVDQLAARDQRRPNNSNNAGNGGRVANKNNRQSTAPDHRRANNSREINAGKNGNKGGGWNKGGQQNWGNGGKWRR